MKIASLSIHIWKEKKLNKIRNEERTVVQTCFLFLVSLFVFHLTPFSSLPCLVFSLLFPFFLPFLFPLPFPSFFFFLFIIFYLNKQRRGEKNVFSSFFLLFVFSFCLFFVCFFPFICLPLLVSLFKINNRNIIFILWKRTINDFFIINNKKGRKETIFSFFVCFFSCLFFLSLLPF